MFFILMSISFGKSKRLFCSSQRNDSYVKIGKCFISLRHAVRGLHTQFINNVFTVGIKFRRQFVAPRRQLKINLS